MQVTDERRLYVVVADNDDTPDDCFRLIRKQLKANPALGVPDNAEVVTKPRSPGKSAIVPDVVVLMLPLAKRSGALETVCYEAAKSNWQKQAECAEKFAQCIGNQNWDTSKKDKLLLSSLLGAVCEKNPTIVLSGAFRQDAHTEELIPLAHECFTPIAELLAKWIQPYLPAPPPT